MLIDCSYFIDGPRHIQNATLGKIPPGKMPNANSEEVNAAIMAYVRMFQRPFLKEALGAPIASAVISYLKLIEQDEDEERDVALDMVIEQLREPFANYVFYKILRDSNSQATMTGRHGLARCRSRCLQHGRGSIHHPRVPRSQPVDALHQDDTHGQH